MKKLLVLVIVATFIFGSVPAFAGGKGPGDGGFFTKLFQGALGDSWKKTPAQVRQEKEQRKRKKSQKKGS